MTADTHTLSIQLASSLAGLGLAWVLTGAARRYAIRVQLLDRPNERSSHTEATPRGGGVAIVASYLLFCGIFAVAGFIDIKLCSALLGSGLLVAVLGFIDDRWHVAARWRFVGHAAAIAWALYLIGPLPPVPVFGWFFDLGFGTPLLAAVYAVWSINLFNFMDGIDGIASVEAITIALCGALLWWLVDPHGDWPLAVLFAACVGGFLIWNFPPARIFMGDAGSGFLGLVIAVLALWSARHDSHLFWAWVILGGCFMVDATTTLLRRVFRGERFHEAHRNHAYQYAARKHGGHKPVTLTVLAINLVWLLPWAVAVVLRAVDGVAGVLLAYAPLLWLTLYFKAGDRTAQEV